MLRQSKQGEQLFIAGTASIVGDMSRHVGDPGKQTMEIVSNLQALIDHVNAVRGAGNGQSAQEGLFKVYLRYREGVSTVRTTLMQHLLALTQIVYLEGAICRSELLLEIEGILTSRSEREKGIR